MFCDVCDKLAFLHRGLNGRNYTVLYMEIEAAAGTAFQCLPPAPSVVLTKQTWDQPAFNPDWHAHLNLQESKLLWENVWIKTRGTEHWKSCNVCRWWCSHSCWLIAWCMWRCCMFYMQFCWGAWATRQCACLPFWKSDYYPLSSMLVVNNSRKVTILNLEHIGLEGLACQTQ